MFKNLLFILVMLCTTAVTYAQRNCGSMDVLEQQIQEDPKRLMKLNAIENATQKFINNPSKAVNGIITIPVVVHVVYNGSTQNISDAQINSQLTVLNDDFRRLNGDADGTWSQADDAEIEFCLATVDPNGNPTSGITRTSTNVSGFGTNDAVKFNSSGGKNAWPASDYLNIWVCDIGGGILGYAQFPGGNPSTDGVVNDYRYFGTIGTATSPFDLGRTMTHEVGHYLNLRHIWGDGNCNVDDFVSDTPTSDNPNYGCATGHVSCSSTDMVQNYMDYSDDVCMNLFTSGQKNRMRAIFDTGGARASLLNSGACGSPPTPTCTDGIQNGNETGVDCGGSDCPPCNTNCTTVNISITLDNYPEETSWAITNSSGSVVASGGTYGSSPDGSTVTASACLSDGCYDFTINDVYGDGICCSYGNGSYNVSVDGSTVASGGSFGSSETTNFCIADNPAPSCTDGIQNGDETGVDCGGSCAPCPTCNDGIQNGNETGVDCGGPDCQACPTCDDGVQNGDETGVDCGGSCAPCNSGCTTTQVDFNNLDSGWGGWTDGGSDCVRSTSAANANSGTRSIRLRDNTNSSVATSPNYSLSGVSEVTVSWTYIAQSMETGEDFWLQASLNGGSSWQTVATYASGSEFSNNVREFVGITLTGNFTNSTRLRFRCDASSNSDYVYIDDILVEACISGAKTDGNVEEDFISEEITYDLQENISEVQLYPNPVSDDLSVKFISQEDGESIVSIMDMNGRMISQKNLKTFEGESTHIISTDGMNSGIYYLNIIQNNQRIVKKFIVIK